LAARSLRTSWLILRSIIFQMRGLASGQLAALDALRYAVLLVLGALAKFAVGIRGLLGGVVLVFVDLV